MNIRTANREGAGFTLVELLVVVAIIALLVSILLPTLNKAKEAARRVVCAVHIRGCGQATIFYAMDYDDWLPTVEVEGESTSWNAALTYDYWGGKAGEYSVYDDTQQRLINPYVGRTGAVSETDSGVLEVFHCPSDSGAGRGVHPTDCYPTLWDTLGRSYSYNSSANDNDGNLGLWRKKITQITNPAMVVMANGSPFNCYFYDWVPFRYSYWHNRNELGWANVVFVDGHVTYLRATVDNPDFQNGPSWTFVYDGG